MLNIVSRNGLRKKIIMIKFGLQEKSIYLCSTLNKQP